MTEKRENRCKGKWNTHPFNFNCPNLMPTSSSLSLVDPNLIYCVCLSSLNLILVVLSKHLCKYFVASQPAGLPRKGKENDAPNDMIEIFNVVRIFEKVLQE